MTGDNGSGGGTRLFARMVGARDLALGLGVLVALDRGAPVRGWLEASALLSAWLARQLEQAQSPLSGPGR